MGNIYSQSGVPISETNPFPIKVPSAWTVVSSSADNAAVTITKAAVTGKKHYITAMEVTITGAPAGVDILIELRDGGTVKWKEYIGNAAPRGERVGFAFTHPIELSTSAAANLYVSAGGVGVIATGNLAGYTI